MTLDARPTARKSRIQRRDAETQRRKKAKEHEGAFLLFAFLRPRVSAPLR